MSWQATVLLGVALVVVGGIVWYERSRPPARLVALVAALAALAVAGRLALAPFPNVVATTDIVLLTGYALGGAPGFAVGALAAPISNLWLGQGPWTPWQMAGWGLVGLAGAALAAVAGRRLGRLWIASVCALAGFAYGALLDLSVMVSYGGEQSLDRYLALSARGLPFNVAHAAGNFAIGLAAGPALVRIISRYRTRLEFTWVRTAATGTAAAILVAVAGLGLALGAERTTIAMAAGEERPAASEPAVPKSATSARRWLERAQNRDGGYAASPGSSSSAAMTGWAMLGLEAAGRNPLDMRQGPRDPVEFLRRRAGGIRSTGDLERTVLALAGAGVSPRGFGGVDLVARLRAKRGSDGSYSGQVNLTAFGVLALRAAGLGGAELGPSGAWLRRVQHGDGGWGFRPDAPSDADSTGAALQALAVAGSSRAAMARGAAFLRRAQRPDGGWPLSGSGASNSQSTAWAVQGLVAAGVDPGGVRAGGRSGLGFLQARQQRDGHYRYSAASDQTPIWVTAQALLAINREALPVAAVPRVSAPGGLPPAPGTTPVSGSQPGAEDAPGAPGGAPTGGEGSDVRGDQGSEEQRRGGGGARGPQEQGEGGGSSAGTRRANVLPAAASAPSDQSDGEAAPTALVVGGLGALAVALGAGFLWYRRTLP